MTRSRHGPYQYNITATPNDIKQEAGMDENPYGYYLYHDRIAWHIQTFAVRHQGDTVEQLKHEIALIKRSLRPSSADENFNRMARQDNAIGVALLLKALDMLEEKQGKPRRAELDNAGKVKVRHKPKLQQRDDSRHVPSSHTGRDEADLFAQLNAINAAKKAAEEAHRRAIEEALAKDPDVGKIKDLGDKIAMEDQELNALLDRADRGDGYATNKQIQDGVAKMLSDMREVELLRDQVQGKYGVKVGGEGPSNGGTVVRAIGIVERRFVNSIGQKYGLGRRPLRAPGSEMPRRAREEMRNDLATLLGYEHQRQLLGGDDEELSGDLQKTITAIAQYDRTQISTDLKRVLADIQRRKATITKQEIDRLADGLVVQLLENERSQQLMGMGSNDTANLLNQVVSTKTNPPGQN